MPDAHLGKGVTIGTVLSSRAKKRYYVCPNAMLLAWISAACCGMASHHDFDGQKICTTFRTCLTDAGPQILDPTKNKNQRKHAYVAGWESYIRG